MRTISFKLLYGRVSVGHLRRNLIRVSVTTNPTAELIAAQVTEACPWNQAPRPLTRDCDRSFGPPYTHRIRAMGICDRPPRRARRGRSDVERTHRLNSSGMPRSYSGVWGGGLAPRPENLRLVLQSGPHSSILVSKNTPLFRRSQTVGDIAAIPILGGLPHLYVPVYSFRQGQLQRLVSNSCCRLRWNSPHTCEKSTQRLRFSGSLSQASAVHTRYG